MLRRLPRPWFHASQGVVRQERRMGTPRNRLYGEGERQLRPTVRGSLVLVPQSLNLIRRLLQGLPRFNPGRAVMPGANGEPNLIQVIQQGHGVFAAHPQRIPECHG